MYCYVVSFRVNQFIMFPEVKDCNSFHTAVALIDNEVDINISSMLFKLYFIDY